MWGNGVCYDENDEDDLIEWGFELYGQLWVFACFTVQAVCADVPRRLIPQTDYYRIQPIKHIISGYDRLMIIPVGELDLCPFYGLAEDPGGKAFLVDSFSVSVARSIGDVVLGAAQKTEIHLSEPFRMGDCDYEFGFATLADLETAEEEEILDSEEQEIRLLQVLKPHKVFSFYELDLELDEEASSAEVTRSIIVSALEKVFPLENDEGPLSPESARGRRLLEHRLVRSVLKDGLEDDEVILGE